MSLLGKMERRFGRWAIPNLTLYWVLGQALCFALLMADQSFLNKLVFKPQEVLNGEYWRLLMFLFMPRSMDPIFIVFALYFLYLMGSALEHEWGSFRYNIYLLVGYVASVGVAFIDPDGTATNVYLLGSVFLAFAYLYPDFSVLLFFVFPVKIKWLALLTWITYGITFFDGITKGFQFGNWMDSLLILAACANFLLFFTGDIVQTLRRKMHHTRYRMREMAENPPGQPKAPFHRCVVCGVSDQTQPDMEFRYCTLCQGSPCYCMEHINKHVHR